MPIKYITTAHHNRRHELGEMYIQEGMVQKAMFCFEDLVMVDPRNLYATLTYAELCFTVGKEMDL